MNSAPTLLETKGVCDGNRLLRGSVQETRNPPGINPRIMSRENVGKGVEDISKKGNKWMICMRRGIDRFTSQWKRIFLLGGDSAVSIFSFTETSILQEKGK